MKKNIFLGGTVVLLASIVGIFFYVNPTTANPDYICIKDVTGRSCEVESCGEWKDGERVCTGKRTTQVAYYHTRTTCESGYTGIRGGGYTSGASGRKSSDFSWKTENCTVVQKDTESPFGDTEVISN